MLQERFWPTPDQELLLGLCLFHDPIRALQAWRHWKSRVDLDDLDHASFRITSLVYRRLVDLKIDDPDLGRLKGIHRYQWTQNQLAFRGKADLLRTLHGEGIPTMLLKGAALGRTVYPEPTARGMHDLDILVPKDSAARCIALLAERGWAAQHFDVVRTIDFFHACSFLHADYGELDIHWHVMRSRCRAERDRELWQASRELDFDGTPVRVLAPADQLLHACEHGLHHSPVSALQWLVDAAQVIRHSQPPVDWPRLVDQARKFQLTRAVGATLRYLQTRGFVETIPPEIITHLECLPIAPMERIEYFLAGRANEKQTRLSHRLGVAACHYFKLRQDAGPLSRWRGFSEYFRLLTHEKRDWRVVSEEWLRTAKVRWNDHARELEFRSHRFFRLQSKPFGGLISTFEASRLHGFYPVETEFGSPFRWSTTRAQVAFPVPRAGYLIRLELRPYRDLTRLLDDGLTFRCNETVVPPENVRQEGDFLYLTIGASLTTRDGPQILAWTILPWPAPGDPRKLGLPLTRLWIMRNP